MDTRGGRGGGEGGRSVSVVVKQRSQCVRDGPVVKSAHQSMRRGVARTSLGVLDTVCVCVARVISSHPSEEKSDHTLLKFASLLPGSAQCARM